MAGDISQNAAVYTFKLELDWLVIMGGDIYQTRYSAQGFRVLSLWIFSILYLFVANNRRYITLRLFFLLYIMNMVYPATAIPTLVHKGNEMIKALFQQH